MKRVIGILSSIDMYGKERSNIEVYNLLKDKENVDFYIVTNKNASARLKKAVNNLQPLSIIIPNRHSAHFRLLSFLIGFLVSNIQLLFILLRLRPHVLLLNNEIDFYNFYPVLSFYNGNIIYRIGDEPAFTNLSFKSYNSHVWYRYVVKRVTCFVCISNYIFKLVQAVGRTNPNDRIIYNYPPARKNIVKNETGLYVERISQDVIFGFIGQVFEQKGVHHFIACALKILQSHPQSLFYIAGSLERNSSYSEKLKKMIPEKYKENIVFLGEIEDVSTFFQHIDVLCVPSIKQEPLGNVLVEAKEFSKPCVIYPSGGMPELIRHKIDGYICREQSSQALLEGMNYYVGHRELAVQQGKASHDSIKILGIDRDSFEKKWCDTFEEVFNK